MTGVQYRLTGTDPYLRNGSESSPGVWSGTQLGALRGGGYDEARIGDPTKLFGAVGGHGPASASKIAVGAAAPVTSAHLDLDGVGGVVATNIAWGNGQNGSGVGPTVELTCVACHNPHGNGQYRILRPIPELAGTEEADLVTYPILSSTGSTVTLVSSIATLMVGDKVAISGNSQILSGTYTVGSIGNSNLTITLSDLSGATPAGFGGTLQRTSGMVVTDAALPGVGDVRNYTVIQRSSDALLYASDILAGGSRIDVIEIASSDATSDAITTAVAHGFTAGDTVTINYHNAVSTPTMSPIYTGTVASIPSDTTFTLTGVDITASGTEYGWVRRSYTVSAYAATDGDYFHRIANWPTLPLSGTYDNPVGTSPSTSASNSSKFDDQITAWCSACHTRYYAWQEPVTSVNIVSSATDDTITTATAHGLSAGNYVVISDHNSTPALNGYTCAVATVPTTTTLTCSGLDITAGGAGGSLVPTTTAMGASYANARPGDDIYKFQHRTRDNRACTTCHVAHGSNALMSGTFSSTTNYPDGSISASSRLLKVENRGTCQLCHDPTSTAQSGWVLGASSATGQ
jgi:cytochrome c553